MADGDGEEQGFWKRNWRAVVAASLLAVLVVVLASSEAWFRAVLSDWSDDCVIVVRSAVVESEEGPVAVAELAMEGEVPPNIEVIFEADEPVIERISFQKSLSDQRAYARHPEAGLFCEKRSARPCSLEPEMAESFRSVGLSIDNVKAAYVYEFNIVSATLEPAALVEAVRTVVEFPAAQGEVCRVEPPSILNMTVGLSGIEKALWSGLALLLITALVVTLRKWSGQ